MKKYAMIACLVLALISALVYLLLIWGIMEVSALESEEGPPSFFYVVPAGYIIGGLLNFLKKRCLWITRAILNAIPIIGFYIAYAARANVMFSAPGLITKVAQILLEICLIYLIVTFKRVKAA